MNDFIDASVFTRAESVTRLNYEPRFERDTRTGYNTDMFEVDNTSCQPYSY